jgi:trans-aconitate methyltransferase
MTDFSEISKAYERDSRVQRSAGRVLLDLLAIGPGEDVLDLGCGTGHITREIKDITGGRVVGVDQAEGMIEMARSRYSKNGISFECRPAENLGYEQEFDAIYCNSAFQWFSQPGPVLDAAYAALRDKGRMAIQSPATDDYCPNFIAAIDEVRNHVETRDSFGNFRPPWFFLNSAEEYLAVFETAGFQVAQASISETVSAYTVDEAFRIFESGAAAGYLNEEHYAEPINEDYLESFRKIVRSSFERQAGAGDRLELSFYRIYLLANKGDG